MGGVDSTMLTKGSGYARSSEKSCYANVAYFIDSFNRSPNCLQSGQKRKQTSSWAVQHNFMNESLFQFHGGLELLDKCLQMEKSPFLNSLHALWRGSRAGVRGLWRVRACCGCRSCRGGFSGTCQTSPNQITSTLQRSEVTPRVSRSFFRGLSRATRFCLTFSRHAGFHVSVLQRLV